MKVLLVVIGLLFSLNSLGNECTNEYDIERVKRFSNLIPVFKDKVWLKGQFSEARITDILIGCSKVNTFMMYIEIKSTNKRLHPRNKKKVYDGYSSSMKDVFCAIYKSDESLLDKLGTIRIEINDEPFFITKRDCGKMKRVKLIYEQIA